MECNCPFCGCRFAYSEEDRRAVARLTFERDEALDSCKMWRGIACEQQERADGQQARAEANFAELTKIRQILELERGALAKSNADVAKLRAAIETGLGILEQKGFYGFPLSVDRFAEIGGGK